MVSAGFMAGFGTTLSQLIEDDRKYYRDAAAKRREYIQTYGTRAVVDREEKANAALSVANQLMAKGFSQDYVTNIASTNGVMAMADLAEQVLSRDDLTEADIKEIESTAKDFVKDNPDQDLNTVIQRAFGLYKSESDPVKRKTSLFGSMLGLDARTMEDDVLNDMYINGYTGDDIYRIMGSAGPKPGKPLSVKLPPKPLTPTQESTYAKFIVDQFDTALSGKIDQIGTSMNDMSLSPTARQNARAQHDKLLALQEQAKTDPFGAISTYITVEDYKGQDFFTVLQDLETSRAGMITRNTLVSDSLKKTFKTLSGDAADDAAMEKEQTGVTTSATTTVTTAPTTPPAAGEPGSKGNPITITAQDFDAEVEAGTLQDGATYSVDGKVVTYKAEKNKVAKAVDMSGAPGFRERDTIQPVIKTASRLLDGKDGKLESYNELYSTMMELPEEQRSEYASMFMQLEDNPDLVDAWNVIQEEAPGATDWAVGKVFGGAKWALGAFSEGLARAYSRLGGDTATATEQVLRSRENREKAKEIMADGIVQYLEEVANEAGVTGAWGPERGKLLKDSLTSDSTLDKAIESLYNPRAIGTVGFQDLGLREDVRDDPEVVEELRKAGLVMPVPDDSMDAKARRGTGRTAMIEPVLPESTPDPLKSARTLARLRRTNPEYFIDTPPAVTDGDTASQVAAQARTGGDRAPGLMSRMTPNKPVDIEAEAAPKVGESEFLPLMKRVHGPKSDVVERFSDKVASGKITVADITRLIKSTQGLPKTKSRDTLLASLYEYRDVMNKR